MKAIGLTERSCSVCGAQRDGTDRYCASCGYDFETGEALPREPRWQPPPAVFGRAPVEAQRPSPPQPTPAAPPAALLTPPDAGAAVPAPATVPAGATTLVLAVGANERRFKEPGSPPPPTDLSERVFMADRSPLVIGRDSSGLDIPIHDDPFVSRRHAEIVWMADGWGIRDLGSTNGTRVNGVAVEGSEVRPLGQDDVVEVGFFSELKVRGESR